MKEILREIGMIVLSQNSKLMVLSLFDLPQKVRKNIEED